MPLSGRRPARQPLDQDPVEGGDGPDQIVATGGLLAPALADDSAALALEELERLAAEYGVGGVSVEVNDARVRAEDRVHSGIRRPQPEVEVLAEKEDPLVEGAEPQECLG